MPSEPRPLHPFTVISRALRLARQLLVPAVLGGASVGGDLRGVLLWMFLILAVPSILLATAQWLAFRFRLEEDDLIIDSGVVGRRRRVIPIDRVQNVDLEQSALERLFGVAELRIETASGGREAEASLSVLPVDEARAVRADLLARRASARATAETTPEEIPLVRLTTFDLALAGATANEAGLIAAGLATLLEVAGRFGALTTLADWFDDAIAMGSGAGAVGAITAVALLVLAFVLLGWIVSIVATVGRFHGFTLTRVGDDLRSEHGLFSRHHTTIPLARVQAVRVKETLARRALGLVALKIDTAGAGPKQDGGGGRAEAHVPISLSTDVGRLLGEVLPGARLEHALLHPVAPASRRREFVRLILLIAAGTAGLALYGAPRPWIALLLVAPAWYVASARYRARGWARDHGHVLAREGLLTRTTWVVPRRKIQTLHLSETPFQRRWDLATLLVDTAAGGRTARVVDLERATAFRLLGDLRDNGTRAGGDPAPAPDPPLPS